jgi:hypothetical protein
MAAGLDLTTSQDRCKMFPDLGVDFNKEVPCGYVKGGIAFFGG